MMPYKRSDQSYELLNPTLPIMEFMKHKVWTENIDADLYTEFDIKMLNPTPVPPTERSERSQSL